MDYNIKTGKREFWINETWCLFKNLEATICYITSLCCYKTFLIQKKSTLLVALVLFYLAPLLGGKAFPAPPLLSPDVVCRHCSLSRLLFGFQDGQINFAICKMLGEMAFSRMATNIFHLSVGEQHWILANHVSCWNRRQYKELYFLEFLQIMDLTLPE